LEKKIKGRMRIQDSNAEIIKKSIKPDNLANLETHAQDEFIITNFTFPNINQAIASLDDLLKCIEISKEVSKKWK